ncbi:MAG TPA: HEPN domain-containing protein [Chloroflexi bacterium]|nr:HEPN domain-containing protein [Chloroflexota bacterium]
MKASGNDTQRKKRKAAEEFTRRLLSTEVGDCIARVVLFGSVAKGYATEESDVDVMVVALDAPEKVREAALDVSFEMAMESGEMVEPIVHCIDEWRLPASYLIYTVRKKGQEIYSMDEDKVKVEECRGYSLLAQEYLQGAEQNFHNGAYRIAIDAAYNAAELCAKGLLLLKLEELPATHGGIINKIGELYVKPGLIPRELGRRLHTAFILRNQARYEPHVRLGKDEAVEAIETARAMCEALASQLQEFEGQRPTSRKPGNLREVTGE